MTAAGADPSAVAVLSLGSNLGDRLWTLQGALDCLAETPGARVLSVSPVYATDPVGGPEQGEYLNAVVLLEWRGTPRLLLERALAVEETFGRVRSQRWGARTLDVDVITVGAVRSEDPDLTLPHPRAAERAFVLAPWADLDPDARIPGSGPVSRLLSRLDRSGVRRRDDLVLLAPAEEPRA